MLQPLICVFIRTDFRFLMTVSNLTPHVAKLVAPHISVHVLALPDLYGLSYESSSPEWCSINHLHLWRCPNLLHDSRCMWSAIIAELLHASAALIISPLLKTPVILFILSFLPQAIFQFLQCQHVHNSYKVFCISPLIFRPPKCRLLDATEHCSMYCKVSLLYRSYMFSEFS